MQQEDDVGPASCKVSYCNNNDKDNDNDYNAKTNCGTINMTTISEKVDRQNESSSHDKQQQIIDDEARQDASLTLPDLIGEFGFYQLSLTLIGFIRYVAVAMMTNTGPLIAPSVEFYCVPPSSLSVLKPDNMTLPEYLKNKCSINYIKFGQNLTHQCSSWNYNLTQHGITLTDTFDLVCDRDVLRSGFQSTVSVGVVVAAILWGTFSDRHGRYQAIKVSTLCSLASGIASYFASNLLVYTIARAICTFSDIGLVLSLSTLIVETLGNRYRGPVCIIIYTGWSVGVMIMPWLTEFFRDFRQLMLFTVVYHLLTIPWLLTTNESIRWLLVNGHIDEAGEGLRIISRWNLKGDKRSIAELDGKFDKLKSRYIVAGTRRKIQRELEVTGMSRLKAVYVSTIGGFSKVGQVFQTKELIITTTTLIWITFNSELIYMLFILINSDVGDNVKLNYIIGGIMELIATLLSLVLISYVSRRLSLISTLLSISCLCLAISFNHEDPSISVWLLNITKLAISNLSSLVYVSTTESFPTDLRQTGFGTVGTFGSFGAVVAPFIRTELVEMIGMRYVMLIFVILPLSAASIIPFLLRETKGVELADDVDDIGMENFDNSMRRRGSSISRWVPSVLAMERE